MKFWWICIFLSVSISFSVCSQIDHQKDRQFFNYLYNFEFSAADSILTTIDSTRESGRFNFLMSHYMRWYYLPMHQQSKGILDQYKEYLEATDFKNDSEELNHIHVNSALLKAEFNYNQGNYYKAFQQGAQVYNVVKNNLDRCPDQEELMLLSGLYHYFYQHYKSENPVYEPMMWFFKEGDKETGLKWLQKVAEGESIARTEALIYLSHIYLRLENEPDSAYKYASKLHQSYPDNLKFYELLIESSFSEDTDNGIVTGLIQKLLNADKVYFRKYGVCYNALFKSKFGDENHLEKVQIIEEALEFINDNSGGNHLSSLLYNNLFELTGDDEYFKLKDDMEQYQYTLTGYSLNHSK